MEHILRLLDSTHVRAIADRRDFHAYPETAWTEFRTTSRIARRLDALGWEVRVGHEVCAAEARMGVPPTSVLEEAYQRAAQEGADLDFLPRLRGGFTGVLATLRGKTNSRGATVALRFDIDALEVAEEQDPSLHVPAREGFVSNRHGLMHACGHDGHAAIGLGVASLLVQLHNDLAGTVRLVFQPAEEGTRGAASMVAAGALDGVDYFLCPHVGVEAQRTGEVLPGITSFLATTKLDAHFRGAEAHAGLSPETGRNALLAAATAALGFHALPRHSGGDSRVNVGVLHAGSGRNVIPAIAVLKAELRGDTSEVIEFLEGQARAVVAGAAGMYGVEHRVDRVGAAPSASSDEQLVTMVAEAARTLPGVTVRTPTRARVSDDATSMMARVQAQGGLASYIMLGSAMPSGHHTPRFDFDEAVLATGIGLLTALAIRLANRPK
jgi:aminobenzoyl-glutamate utilization protein A